jgi:aminobenzoyl-glutamate utilization protein B
MATPIAHKGVVAGAKVQAMTVLDLLTKPRAGQQAWDYFRNVQTKDRKYISFIKGRHAAGHLAERGRSSAKYREEMKKYYYDPTRYPTYLEQLGISSTRRGPPRGTAASFRPHPPNSSPPPVFLLSPPPSPSPYLLVWRECCLSHRRGTPP